MKKIDLDIQLFADNLDIDLAALKDLATQFATLGAEIYDYLQDTAKDVLQLKEDETLNSIAGDVIQTAFNKITPYFGEFQTVVGDLGKFLSFVVSTYEFSDEAFKKEFEAWGTTIDAAIGNIKSGLNSTVAQGSYTTTQYISDMSTSTKNIVNEVSVMFKNTGNLYTSATGKTVLGTIQEIGNAAVGSFKTLWDSSSSILPNLFGSL